MFVFFSATPKSWRCYSEVGVGYDGKPKSQMKVVINASQSEPSWGDSCTIEGQFDALDVRKLPLSFQIAAGNPIDTPELSEFRPRNAPDHVIDQDFNKHETPFPVCGTIDYVGDPRSDRNRGELEIDLTVSDRMFDDLWQRISSTGEAPRSIYINAFGSALEYRAVSEANSSSMMVRGGNPLFHHECVDWLWHAGQPLFISHTEFEYDARHQVEE